MKQKSSQKEQPEKDCSEDPQQTSLTRLKETLQQVALYFDFDSQDWVAKRTYDLLMDAYLWHCVVQLGVWCAKEDEFCHSSLAVLYLASCIFFSTPWAKQFDFLDWHIHVFRRFYMLEYDANTFAGHPCVELKVLFAETWQDLQPWCTFVLDTQTKVTSKLQQAQLRNAIEVQKLNTMLL